MMDNSISIFFRLVASFLLMAWFGPLQAATDLADKPLFTSSAVTGNVALALSVEFPTALGSAYTSGYATATTYIGYFDPEKCYTYHTEATPEKHYFEPVAAATGHTCTGKWSGNFLNWALTQTIDPFRYALTGGYRRVDEVGLTVLEKAWASGQGGTVATPTITNNAALIAGATPYNFTDFKIRINGLKNMFYFTSTGNTNAPGVVPADTAIPASPDPAVVYQMYARVKVCAPGMLESNCTAYGSNFKPTGLIQKNALKLNFAAFGYLNDGNINRDGGVLRARMRQLGPLKSVPNSPNITNLNPEWDADGRFILNPDPDDALDSLVANSGVINYLNKFGLTGPGYKTYDPVSELYYTVIRYFKNQGNVPEYTNGATTFMKDGFPVITNWDDPIQYSCQQNFIIGIGDTNSHEDANLPGSTIRGAEPAMPTKVTEDTTVDVRLATNRVGALQGIGNRGEVLFGDASSYFMAGLAYDSHTKDMRPAIDGKQTVSTYWLDVLESGFVNNNQYYLAAKFGGFDAPDNYDTYSTTITPLTTAQWNKDANPDPDNYFRANNPALMITNLNKAFDDILKKISGSSSAFAVTTPSVGAGNMSYATSFNVEGWTGDVIGSTVSISGDSISETLAWNAVNKVETQLQGTGWNTGRYVATSNCTVASSTQGTVNCDGVPFRLGQLDGTQSTLGSTAVGQLAVLNFLRGDRSNSGSLGTLRDRIKLLGDIVNSKVVPVGPPSSPFTDAFNPGYSAFKSAKSGRQTVVYVGANDGMLHAFNGAQSGGDELFAYVPNALFNGPNGTPSDDGLVALAKASYVHHYYVDATPRVVDVNFGGGASDWHSMLVGGLGKGGKSYYALDVTNPSSLSNENNLANAVLWEFKHKHMGYSFGRPLMVKTAKYGWVVILTSGYNNDDGNGYFFIVDPKTGNLLESPIATGAGTVTNEAGLAGVTAYVADARDFTADAAYAGDLLGNVWRLDLTGTSGSYPSPTKIANVARPITVPPVVEVDASTSKRYVFVGTGKLLADSDVAVNQNNTFYAFNDGTDTAFNTSSTLPSGVSFPLGRTNLIDNTSGTDGITTNPPANSMGYFVDLGQYRINVDMRSAAGIIVFAANLTAGNECNPSGSSRTYALTYGTGKSVLSSGGSATKYISSPSAAASVGLFTVNINGVPTLKIVTSGSDGTTTITTPTSSGISGFTQLNWRELPTTD